MRYLILLVLLLSGCRLVPIEAPGVRWHSAASVSLAADGRPVATVQIVAGN